MSGLFLYNGQLGTCVRSGRDEMDPSIYDFELICVPEYACTGYGSPTAPIVPLWHLRERDSHFKYRRVQRFRFAVSSPWDTTYIALVSCRPPFVYRLHNFFGSPHCVSESR